MIHPTRRMLLRTAATSALLSPFMTVQPTLAQPKRGGTLTSLLTPEPPILIPGVNNQGPTLIVQSKIYQSLLEFSPTLEPKPLLAKSWELSDDKKTYTFHLQENVKFHDGQPMTADDVIFSIMKFHFDLAPRARGVFSKIKTATAPDPHTVVLTLDDAVRAVPADVRRDHRASCRSTSMTARTTATTRPTRSRSAPGRSSSWSGSAATSSAEALRRLLEAGPALSRRHHLPHRAGQPEPRARAADRAGA